MGWVVQILPDNTIPDPIDPTTREKQYSFTTNDKIRRRKVLAGLEEQVQRELKAGTEIQK
jgi:hypothetical protein